MIFVYNLGMPLSDFQLIFQWWGTLFLVGAAAYPLTRRLFHGWHDDGYFFAKAVGMAVVTFLVYLGSIVHIIPFTQGAVWGVMGVVFVLGVLLSSRPMRRDPSLKFGFRVKPGMTFFFEEVFFFGALLFWSWVKAHEPSIRGLEKFMDYGFTQSILNTKYFPAPDMWFAGSTINYYYFGHTVMAVLTRLSGIDLSITFNLMLATIFAFTATMSFSIGRELIGEIRGIREIGKIAGGIFTAFLVTMAGNMQTLYAFTRGYTGDNVKPFWQLGWNMREIWGKLGEGMNTYWYANATRFIPYTIHEFPSYSFVVSDVHGHVLSIPFVLLAIALLVKIWGDRGNKPARNASASVAGGGNWGALIFYGFLCGVLLMTNALDGPIYFGLFAIILVISNFKYSNNPIIQSWKNVSKIFGVVLFAAAITSLPFLLHFKSFVSGIAVNCPPDLISNTKIGPILFEGVEKCQHSPIWMMWLLWGFFIYCGGWLMLSFRPLSRNLFFNKGGSRVKPGMTELLLVIFFVFSLALIIFPEFFYFKDIYPMHFRSNTMFKLGYDAFILFSIVSGYTIARFFTDKGNRGKKGNWGRRLFFVLLAPQLFLVSIYPIFSVRSYFNSLKNYEGLYGLTWIRDQYPDDWAGINWLNSQNAECQMLNAKCKTPVIVEADGDSYTDYDRFSAFTGLPTIIGWPVHEWLWRGSYDVVAPRREEVRQVYESDNIELTRSILSKYHVGYIVVGQLERQKFKNLYEAKIKELGNVVFTHDETTIYKIGSI